MVLLSQHTKKKLKEVVEAYIFQDANIFKGYLFPKEWYGVSPANCDDDDDDDDDEEEEEEEEEEGEEEEEEEEEEEDDYDDDDDDDDDENNYIMTGYIKLT